MIKKHPFQLGWSENEEGFTNIRYVTEKLLEEKEVFLYSLVGVCDGLLTDYSSIAVDFILLNRPIGFVLTDYELYEKARGFVFEKPLDYMPGEKIYNFTELQGFFEHVGDGKDLFAEERQRLLPVMHNPTENYSARLAETLHLARQEERQWQN